MQLSPAYLQWREETLQQGRQEGRQEGIQQVQRLWIENLLKSRFGKIDKSLEKVIEPLLKASPEETSRWLLELSRPELVAKFSKKKKSSRVG